MDFELIFSIAGILAMLGWVGLVFSPFMPVLSDRLSGYGIPLVLALGYCGLLLLNPVEKGGFGSLEDVGLLFTNPASLLAGWAHFLAFDLVVGAWICRTGRKEGIKFWMILPCLPVTFLFGPAGFLLFTLIRFAHRNLFKAAAS
ncbi:MAG: DUF4281 domain-containing protein [Sneathiellales bacterium]|nr:DUF4281 domain-containing protein [Sneathiellales bacterium]